MWVYVAGAPPRLPRRTLCLCNAPVDSDVGVEVLTAPGTKCLSLGYVISDSL